MKKNFSLFPTLICVLIFSLQTAAQNTAPTNNQTRTAEDKTTDVSITATVTVRELKFEIVPNPTVEFFGKPARETVWEADRENLPRPVEPGVTYRDIGIRLHISSRFADIERIVAEALGEIPVENKTDTPPANSPIQNQPGENETKPVSQTTNAGKKTPSKTINRRRR